MWDFQSRYIPYSFPLLHSLQLSDAAYPEFYNLVKQLEHEGGGMRDPNAKPAPPGRSFVSVWLLCPTCVLSVFTRPGFKIC